MVSNEGAPSDTSSDSEDDNSERPDTFSWIAPLTLGAIVVISFVVSALRPLQAGDELDVVAHLAKSPDGTDAWSLRGRVLHTGEPVENARVWAIVRDSRGNRASPPSVLTGAGGEFEIPGVPAKLAGEGVTEATVYARARLAGATEDAKPHDVKGTEELAVSGKLPFRRVRISALAFAFLPAIFLASIAVAFFPLNPKLRHVMSIGLAFLLTAAMIVSISMGLSFVQTQGRPGEILSLGFASLYHGHYVAEVQDEWLITLTSPVQRGLSESGQKTVSKGFGAPLWVLLVAVIGAALLTVTLIVSEIKDRPDYKDVQQVRERLERITRHQFYILFAPFGVIFVYQGLVILGSASEAVTVALAALGAGATLNYILQKGIEMAQHAFGSVVVAKKP